MYAAIEEWQQKEFEYGSSDCCAFVGAVIEAMTNINPWDSWEGQYDDAESAREILDHRGYRNLYQAIVSTLGGSRPVSVARRGDVVYGSSSGVDFAQLGICLGVLSVSWGDDGGLVQVPTLKLKRSFRI